jgi:spore germination protein GerM
MMRTVLATMPLALLLLAACGDRAGPDLSDRLEPMDGADTIEGADGPVGAMRADSVSVYFTRDEAPVEVRRSVAGRAADIRATLETLLAGPTSDEQEQGIESWFNDDTAGMLRSVEVDGSHVVVDFGDLRQVIPNASSSTGSGLLLQELNATVFQFPELHSIEYLINGSCAAFWEWLQYECHTVTRPAL